MDPMVKHLQGMAQELKDILTYFLVNHSEIEARKPYDEIWCMGPEGDRYFADMDSRGTKLQAFLKEEYALFYTTLLSLLAGQPQEVMSKVQKAGILISRIIDHKLTFAESSKQAANFATEALEGQMKILIHAIEEEERISKLPRF